MTSAPDPTPLGDALDRARFGGKAANLAQAIRAGLPVPLGFALSTSDVAAVLRGEGAARIEAIASALSGAVAVRSSAIDEDGITVSFAGQLATRLGVRGASAMRDAIVAIVDAASTAAAAAYRSRSGAARRPTLGVVVQPMICADSAGVLFTRHPVTGADQRVVEASFGLGETVVSGRVDPDRFVVARGGAVLERVLGEKRVVLRCTDDGLREESQSEHVASLSDDQLRKLDRLATICEAQFGGDQDLEWAFLGPQLFLLQWRPITVRRY